jgi:hypothetical protein
MWLNLTLDFEATDWSWDSPLVECMEFYKIMTEYMNSHEPQADYVAPTFQISKEVGIAEIVKVSNEVQEHVNHFKLAAFSKAMLKLDKASRTLGWLFSWSDWEAPNYCIYCI